MSSLPDDAARLCEAVQARTRDVVAALRAVPEGELEATTALAGWSRLTIACHLRYGAEALGRITTEGLAGRPAAYYPGGRTATRPATLLPRPGESAADVVDDLDACSTALQRIWDALGPADWARVVPEPAEEPDLGGLALAEWALLRLTEVEVHGTDLDLGLVDWSDTFVRAALPWRIARLARRSAVASPPGTWVLSASDGGSYTVTVGGGGEVTLAGARDEAAVAALPGAPSATLEGPSRDLLALLLGRAPGEPLRVRGDRAFARGFSRAFPGP